MRFSFNVYYIVKLRIHPGKIILFTISIFHLIFYRFFFSIFLFSPIKILLVFHKNDNVYDALISACNRLQFDITITKCMETANDAFQHTITGGHHIVIVDGRYPKNLDPEIIGR